MESTEILRYFHLTIFVFVLFYSNDGKEVRQLKGNSDINIMAITSLWGENYTLNYETGIMPLVTLKYMFHHLYEEFSTGYRIKYRPDLQQDAYGFKFNLRDVYYQDSNDVNDADKMYKKVLSWRNDESNPPWFIIGPRTSSELLHLNSLLPKPTPLFSYGASSVYLQKYALDWNNTMFTSVSSDTLRIRALIDLLDYYDWNFIGAVTSPGLEGRYEYDYFLTKITHKQICVPITAHLNDSQPSEMLENRLKELANISQVKVIVAFTNDLYSRTLLKALKSAGLSHRYILVFLFGSLNYIEVYRGYEDVALGSVVIDQAEGDWQESENWFLTRNPENDESIHFHLLWEDIFKCRLKNSKPLKDMKPPKRKYYPNICTGKEKLRVNHGFHHYSLSGHMLRLFVYLEDVIDTVLHHNCLVQCVDDVCSNKNQLCTFNVTASNIDQYYISLLERIRVNRYNSLFLKHFFVINSVRYYRSSLATMNYRLFSFQPFDGIIQSNYVGRWQFKIPPYAMSFPMLDEHLWNGTTKWYIPRTPFWKNHPYKFPPKSTCGLKCDKGFYRKPTNVLNQSNSCQRFCWECVKCMKNHVIKNNTCIKCPFDSIANITTNMCELLPKIILDMKNPISYHMIILLVWCGVGCSLVLLLFIILLEFLKFDEHHLLSSADRLSYTNLFIILSLFLSPLPYFRQPDLMFCTLRELLPWIPILTLHTTLLLKVIQLHRSFKNRDNQQLSLVTVVSALFLVSTIHLLISGIWLLDGWPGEEKELSTNGAYVTIHCKASHNNSKTIVYILPSMLLQIIYTIPAFRLRNFAMDYFEGRRIFYCSIVTQVLNVFFIVLNVEYDNTDNYVFEYTTCALSFLSATFYLVGLFLCRLPYLLKKRTVRLMAEITQSRATSPYELNMNIPSSSNKELAVHL